MNEKNVLIINHFGMNKGDAAILIGSIAAISKTIRNVKIVVESSDPEITFARTNGKAKIVERVVERKENGNPLRWGSSIAFWVFQSILWGLLKRYDIDIKRIFCHKKQNILKEYENADLIASGGGGYIRDNSGLVGYLPLYSISLAIIIRKPVMIFAQSIGPINSRSYKFISRKILDNVRFITLRDVLSLELLNKINVKKPKILVTADAAFYFHLLPDPIKGNDILNKEGIERKGKRLIGVTLMHWHYPNSPFPLIKHENYKQTMAEVLDYVIEKLDSQVVFISMNTNREREDEVSLAKEIIKKMNNKHNTNVIVGEYSPEELKDLISQLDMVIGTRLHSLIFASTVGVPVVSIMYEHKAMGIMKMLNLEKYVCDIDDLKKEDLISKINEVMINESHIKSELKVSTELMRNLALINAKLLEQLDRFSENGKIELISDDANVLMVFNPESAL